MERLDKLGRRIPDFDRSAANKKGAQTKKEVHGEDYFSRITSLGGRRRTRGYLGKLKDEGKTEELRQLASKAGRASWGPDSKRVREPKTPDVGGR